LNNNLTTLENIKMSPDFEKISSIECPIERAMELIGDKYSVLIVLNLAQFGTQRFIELEQSINGISPRTLSARLKHLEKYGIINRKQFSTIPPKVEYSLTDRGEEFKVVIENMSCWVNKWYPYSTQK
jgi:DNA-binding HxlR family transcriptional regulator